MNLFLTLHLLRPSCLQFAGRGPRLPPRENTIAPEARATVVTARLQLGPAGASDALYFLLCLSCS